MAHATVDPITRIEGHLSVDVDVEDGKVTKAWSSGNLYRGLENCLTGRTPYDSALISERICGVCPVSHVHASCYAAEQAYGIQIPEGARHIRNLAEGGQILHSTILWFYNLVGLDYINPLDAVSANPNDAYDVCKEFGTSSADFIALHDRLKKFADNGQLSIFSGNWFDAKESNGNSSFHLTPAQNLVGTAHYFEGIENQAKSSQICAMIGGKMPHIMTSIPGGTSFVPTPEKLDEIIFRIRELKSWITSTMIPDMYMLLAAYPNAVDMGKGEGRFVSFGVLDAQSRELNDRYLPAGMVTLDASGKLHIENVDEKKITEDTTHAYFETHEPLNPVDGVTQAAWPKDGKNFNNKYTWCKAPRYANKTYQAGGIARMMAGYARNVDGIVSLMDEGMQKTGLSLNQIDGVAGRLMTRVLEASYVCDVMEKDFNELVDLMKEGKAEYFVEPARTTGEGVGLWEAPRGALLHTEKVENNTITHYQEIIPSTWNLSPRDGQNQPGPLEKMLENTEVTDLDKPLDVVRIVHSVDPCTACACHVTEPKTGHTFSTVTTPWGVK